MGETSIKIGVADNNNGKFTTDLVNHWRDIGHEVRFEQGASEYIAQWADVYYIDTWDNNIHYIYKLYHGDEGVSRPADWDNNKKPKIIVRALDWEVWIGFARDQSIIDWVDQVVVITPHIETELRKYADFKNKITLIKPGVNLDKFTLKTKETDGYQIGMVLGDMWKYKNHMGGLDIFTSLYHKDKRYRLHIRGQHENSTYDPTNFEHYLSSRGIRDVVTLYGHVEDMNEWYENIDVLIHPGQKEAFCYAVGEAMAKGIKPVINNFYGSEDIWSGEFLYNTHQQAVSMIYNNQGSDMKPGSKNSRAYRDFILDRYSLKRMFEQYDILL